AASGVDALRMLAAKDYGVVVLDLLMPGMDGYEVLRRIVDGDPAQRVLVLSAVGDVESRVRCLRMGAADYMPQPFAMAELVERVKRRLEERAVPAAPRWLEVGGVRLDLQRRVLRVAGREIPLSQREFTLLDYLMRHAGEVCSRDELLSDV